MLHVYELLYGDGVEFGSAYKWYCYKKVHLFYIK